MYLSKLVFNPRNPQVYRDLSNAHALHQRVMQGFPDEQSSQPRADWNILFRQEPGSQILLVQSDIAPDWERLPAGYLEKKSDTKFIAMILKQLEAEMVLQFRLKANPSKRDKTTGKTVAITGRVEQTAWLERQATAHGFEVLVTDCIATPDIYGYKTKSTPPIKIINVIFQGKLKIIEPGEFTKVLRCGIGRGRSYGCGLLSIARVSHD